MAREPPDDDSDPGDRAPGRRYPPRPGVAGVVLGNGGRLDDAAGAQSALPFLGRAGSQLQRPGVLEFLLHHPRFSLRRPGLSQPVCAARLARNRRGGQGGERPRMANTSLWFRRQPPAPPGPVGRESVLLAGRPRPDPSMDGLGLAGAALLPLGRLYIRSAWVPNMWEHRISSVASWRAS